MSSEFEYDPVENVEKSSEYSSTNGMPEEGVATQARFPLKTAASAGTASIDEPSTVPLKTTFSGHFRAGENPHPLEFAAIDQANAASALAERFFDILES